MAADGFAAAFIQTGDRQTRNHRTGERNGMGALERVTRWANMAVLQLADRGLYVRS